MSEFDFEKFAASFNLVCELEDEYVWGSEFKVDSFQEPLAIAVDINRLTPTVVFSDKQRLLVEDIVNSCEKYYKFWMGSTIQTLQDDPSYWGMIEEDDEFYELILSIKSVKELEENVNSPSLHIFPDNDSNLVYGFGFEEAKFDLELGYGYGVLYANGKIEEAGPYVPLISDYQS